MPISLVPADVGSPKIVTEADIEKMSEPEAKAFLLQLSGPKLDAFKASIPAMPTSQLLIAFLSPQLVASEVAEGVTQHYDQLYMTAAMLALTDEIDQRIPPRR